MDYVFGDTQPVKILFKPLSRMDNFPLTDDIRWDSKADAEAYIQTPVAYEGQILTVKEDGVYNAYIVQKNGVGLKLEKVSTDIKQEDLKAFVQVVDILPNHDDAEEEVIYIIKSNGNAYYKVAAGFMQLNEETFAPINNPVFTGTVTLSADPSEDLEAVTKQYVDRLINGLVTVGPGVVDSKNPLPATGYRAGETWRVAEPGTYAGDHCEPGDLIMCIKDYAAGANPQEDFLILQANLTNAVTGPNASTVGHIVVFDNITGTKIADSEVTIDSLKETIKKAHTHNNKEILDSFDKTQGEILNSIGENLTDKIGDIPEGTSVKEYIDNAIGSGGVDVAEVIAQAKAEAIADSKKYTESVLTLISF